MDVRALATDGVVIVDGEVVLLERDHPPCEGEWVLPGGLVELGERAREACIREIREEIGLRVYAAELVGFYDDPDRDERGYVSAAYRCLPLTADPSLAPRDEARRVETFPLDSLPPMGFDHEEIVADTIEARSRTIP